MTECSSCMVMNTAHKKLAMSLEHYCALHVKLHAHGTSEFEQSTERLMSTLLEPDKFAYANMYQTTCLDKLSIDCSEFYEELMFNEPTVCGNNSKLIMYHLGIPRQVKE